MTDLTTDQTALIDHFTLGFAGAFDAAQLTRLAEACERDDARLVQRQTTFPPLMYDNAHRMCERCCAVALAAGGDTVGHVTDRFNDLMMDRKRVTTLDRDHPRWAFVLAWDALPRAQALAATALACRRLLAGRAETREGVQ